MKEPQEDHPGNQCPRQEMVSEDHASQQLPASKLSLFKRTAKIIAWPIALGLVIAAAIFGINLETLNILATHIKWWQLPIWFIVIIANLGCTSLLFWRMHRLFEKPDLPIPALQMILIIAASHLLNYLPLPKAGLVVRALYMKKRFEIPISATAGIFGLMFIHAACIFTLMICISIAFPLGKVFQLHWSLITGFGVLFFVIIQLMLLPLIKKKLGHLSWVQAIKELCWWSTMRVIDLFTMLTQVWLAFHWMGVNLNPGRLLSIVTARALAGFTGITPNGLGLSEWVGSWLASNELLGVSTTTPKIAITAMLLYQLMMMLVLIPIGAVGLWWLKREMKR